MSASRLSRAQGPGWRCRQHREGDARTSAQARHPDARALALLPGGRRAGVAQAKKAGSSTQSELLPAFFMPAGLSASVERRSSRDSFRLILAAAHQPMPPLAVARGRSFRFDRRRDIQLRPLFLPKSCQGTFLCRTNCRIMHPPEGLPMHMGPAVRQLVSRLPLPLCCSPSLAESGRFGVQG